MATLQAHADDERIKNPAIILAKWQKYEHGLVEYTKEYIDQVKALDRLAASPLLPVKLREYISEFRSIAHSYIDMIGKSVTEAAKRMPEIFPRATDIKHFSATGLCNSFNNNRIVFQPTATKILDFINGYLKIDGLMN